MYIVELEENVWLAPWQGDPGRTLKIENAKQYQYKKNAEYELEMARKYRPFLNAKIKLNKKLITKILKNKNHD